MRAVKAVLDPDVTFLGFAGSPWTVATYMVAGEGSKDHAAARALAYRDPAAFAVLIYAIVDVTIDYLAGQVAAGVHAVQLFESWAGSLSPEQFDCWVVQPNAASVAGLRDRFGGTVILATIHACFHGGRLPDRLKRAIQPQPRIDIPGEVLGRGDDRLQRGADVGVALLLVARKRAGIAAQEGKVWREVLA